MLHTMFSFLTCKVAMFLIHLIVFPTLIPTLFLDKIHLVLSCLVTSDSLRCRGLQPTWLPCPWGFSSKNTGVGCHALLQGIFLTSLWMQEMRHKKVSQHSSQVETQDLNLHSLTSGEGNGNPLQYSFLGNPMDGGAWQATVYGVAKSRTGLSDFTFTSHFHALEKEMATHSSILA